MGADLKFTAAAWCGLGWPQDEAVDLPFVAASAKLRYAHEPTRPDAEAPTFPGSRWTALRPMERLPAPYLVNAPSDHAAIDVAGQVLAAWSPAIYALRAIITTVHPLVDTRYGETMLGGTCGGGSFGVIYATLQDHVGFAEGLAHETAHWKLHAIGVHLEEWEDLVANDPTDVYASPVRKDKLRPMGAVLHAQYSYLHVTEIGVTAARLGIPRPGWQGWLETNLARLAEGRETLAEHFRVRPGCELFREAVQAWAEDLISRGRALLAGG